LPATRTKKYSLQLGTFLNVNFFDDTESDADDEGDSTGRLNGNGHPQVRLKIFWIRILSPEIKSPLLFFLFLFLFFFATTWGGLHSEA